MIKPVGSYADCREFAESFQGDPDFSDPMLSFEENEPTICLSCRNTAAEVSEENCWPRHWNATGPRA